MNPWMQLIGPAVRNLLVGDAQVASYVGTRVYPHGTATDPDWPYITYVVPLGSREEYVHGADSPPLIVVRLQVDWWCTSYAQAVELGDEVMRVLGTSEITLANWGTCKLFPMDGGGITNEEESGVTYFRGMKRYWALLVES